jgi:polysaccharide biosynthesis/export protein
MWLRPYIMVVLGCLLMAAAPLTGQQEDETRGHEYVPPAGGDAAIRAGDQVGIQIWREPDLSGVFMVNESGEVTLPRLGTMRVSDRSASELQDDLRDAYGRYLRNPSVQVTVLRRIGVHGEVLRPQLYMVDLTMTVRDVIALAGGVGPYGNPDNVVIIRGDERIRLGREESARFATAELRSGDQILVGRRRWWALDPGATIALGIAVASFAINVLRR